MWHNPVGVAKHCLASLASLCLFAVLVAHSAFAQEPAARLADPAPPANPNPDIASRPTIVIPYDDPKNPLAAERVFLPHAKFVELWNAAHPEQRVKALAPQDGLVAEVLLVVVPQTAKDANKPEPEGFATARLFARLTLFSFREQQVVLPLPLKIASLTEARLDEQPAPLVIKDEGGSPRLHVVLDKPGLHVLDLTAELPIQQTGPAGQLSLSLDPLPSGRLLFVPGADANDVTLRVNGASNTFRVRKGKVAFDTNPKRERGRAGIGDDAAKSTDGDSPSLTLRVGVPEGEVTYYEIPISVGGDVRLAWQPKQAAGAVDAIVQADSATAVQVEDAGVRIVSGWQFRVPRGAIADVPFALPKELRVRSITGPDVGGWELADNADGRTLRVFLRRAVSDQTALTFELFLESRFGTEPVSVKVPQFAPLQVTRDFGLVGVFAAPQFALRNVATKGLTQINLNQFQSPVPLPGITSGPVAPALVATPVAPALVAAPLNAFRYTQRPFELSFTAQRKAPESTGFAEHALVVERRKVRMSSRLRWDLTGALRSSVSVQLPQMWLPVDVDATALQDWHIDPLTNVLTVEFTEPRVGAVEVVLQGNVPKEPEDAFAEITAPAPLELSKLTTQAAVWFDPAYKATLTASGGWKTNDPEQCSDELKSKLGRPAQFLLHSANTLPEVVTFDIARAVPKLSADAVTLITVSDTAVDYSLALQWQITEAAADTLIFTTPDWLAGKLDFQGAGIRQTAFVPADKGRTRWTVTLQDPIGARYFLLATATLPPPEKGRVLAPTIGFERQDPAAAENAAAPADNAAAPPPAVLPLDTQRQFAVLINMSSNQLAPVGNVGETVPREELPIVVDQRLVDQATAVLRLRQLGPLPTWSLKSYATQADAPASVNLADLVTVLAADGTWRMQAAYTIKNRSRQFLALQLPKGSQALSVFVADQPSRLVELKRNLKSEIKNQNSKIENPQPYQLIALPKTSEADLSFQVKLVLAGRLSMGRLPRGLRFWSQEFDLPAPTVVSRLDNAEYGIPVSRTLWTVHVPNDWSAKPVNDPNRHNLTQQAGDTADVAYRFGWLQEANDLLRVIEGNYQSSQKLQALSNLKQLRTRIDSSRPGASPTTSEEGRKLSEAVEQFKGKQSELESRVVIESENGATNFYVAKDQQEAAQAHAAQQADKNANGRRFFSQGGQQGGGFQREIVNLNNLDLFLGNSAVLNGEDRNGNGLLDPGEDANGDGILNLADDILGANVDGGLKFKLNLQEEQSSGEKKSERSRGVSQKTKAASGKGVTEEERLARRKQSVEQLDQLNKAVENERQQLVKAQPPQQAAQPQGRTPRAPETPANVPPFGTIIMSDGAVRTVMPSGVDRSRQQYGMNQSGRFGRASGLGGNLGGGGGGFGGGLGGAGVGRDNFIANSDGDMSLEIRQSQAVQEGWTQAGGLSLPIEIQREGNVLRFSRAIGAPRLALAVRPVESNQLSLGLLWTAVWSLIAVWLLRLVNRASTCCTVWVQASAGASVLGLLGMFFLPSPLSQLGFLAFAISAFVLAIGLRHSTRQNAAATK